MFSGSRLEPRVLYHPDSSSGAAGPNEGEQLNPTELGIEIYRAIEPIPGVDLKRIVPDYDTNRTALVYVTTEGDVREQTLHRLGETLSKKTGWEISVEVYRPVPDDPSHDTITSGVVVDVEETPEVVEAELIDPTSDANEIVVTGDSGARFGIIPVPTTDQALSKMVRAGDTIDIASNMMSNDELVDLISQTMPFRAGGPESVRKAILQVQLGRPLDDTIRASAELGLGVKELLRGAQVGDHDPTVVAVQVVAVSNMILGAAGKHYNNSELIGEYRELVGSFDQRLARSLAQLTADKQETAIDAFQTVFSRLLLVAQGINGPATGEATEQENSNRAIGVLTGSLILRHLALVFEDPTKTALHHEMVNRFAGELKTELVERHADEKRLLGLVNLCNEVSFGFFQSVLTHYVAQTNEAPDYSDRSSFAQRGPKKMRSDGVECLLGVACLGWPERFYDELDQKYDHSTPEVRAQYLQAMKFAVGDSPERQEKLVERALELLIDQTRNGTANQTANKCKSLLTHFGPKLAEYLQDGGQEAYKSCSESQRTMLIREVLLPSIQKPEAFPDGREKVLPLVMKELRAGNLRLLDLKMLEHYFNDAFVRSLEPEQAVELRGVLLNQYDHFTDKGAQPQVQRILAGFGFIAVEEAFDHASRRTGMDVALSRNLLYLSAQVAAQMDEPEPKEAAKIRSFVLKSVMPRFQAAVGGKVEAVDRESQAGMDKAQLEHSLDQLERERKALSAAFDKISKHPGFERKLEALETVDTKLGKAGARNDDAEITSLEQEKADLLESKLKPVEACPDWGGKVAKLTLKQMIGVRDRLETVKGEIAGIEKELSAFDTADQWVTMDGSKTFADEQEAKASGEPYRWASKAGLSDGAGVEVESQVWEAGYEAKILRLFLQCKAIDAPTAAAVFQKLDSREGESAFTRFVLSLDFSVDELHGIEPDQDEDDRPDLFRDSVSTSVGVDVGTQPESTEQGRGLTPEEEFASLLAEAIRLESHRNEVESLVEGIQDLAEEGRFVPYDPKASALLKVLITQYDAQATGNFVKIYNVGWSRECNDAVLRTVGAIYRHHGEAKELTTVLDRVLRRSFRSWIENWHPPREIEGHQSSIVLDEISCYLEDPSSANRQLYLAGLFARKAYQVAAHLPASGIGNSTCDVLRVISRTVPEKSYNREVRLEDGGQPIHLKTTVEDTIDILTRSTRRSAWERQTGRTRTDLRLPFGTDASGTPGLMLPGGRPIRPALPYDPSDKEQDRD